MSLRKEYSEHNSRLARRYNGQPSRLCSICEEEMGIVAIGEFPQQLVPVGAYKGSLFHLEYAHTTDGGTKGSLGFTVGFEHFGWSCILGLEMMKECKVKSIPSP